MYLLETIYQITQIILTIHRLVDIKNNLIFSRL